MKKRRTTADDDMRAEYDFSKGTRGKHARQYERGHNVKIQKSDGTTAVLNYKLEEGAVLLAPDVREFFADSDSVNQALRTLIKLIPERRRPATGK